MVNSDFTFHWIFDSDLDHPDTDNCTTPIIHPIPTLRDNW